jgi:hypothetical protein
VHFSGDLDDIHSWVLDWMSADTHLKAPADELLRAFPIELSPQDAKLAYHEPELPNEMMQVLMKPLAPGEEPRTSFLVKDFLYVPKTVYKILAKTICSIKGHNSDTDEVVGVMKNLLFYIIHGVPFNIQEFFMRTLITYAQTPFELKPYAPWIMRFIRSRTSIDYEADKQNHLSFVPPMEVLQSTISSVPGKCKSVVVEGVRSLTGQIHQPVASQTTDDSASHGTNAHASEQIPKAEAPRMMTNRELLISLHQKVDRNHDWVKCQLASIVEGMTVAHNTVHKNTYYSHEIYRRTWAILSTMKTEEELTVMNIHEHYDWAEQKHKRFKPVPVPQMVPSSESPSRLLDEFEDVEDIAAGPSRNNNTDSGAPQPTS